MTHTRLQTSDDVCDRSVVVWHHVDKVAAGTVHLGSIASVEFVVYRFGNCRPGQLHIVRVRRSNRPEYYE
ncbi:MAG TPA: hypothetical protein VMT89_14715 [Candidatus Acidoferrales bacterium]|nr:hypothetical protein [Candidatus Acidoferrales bacterium]